MVEIKEESKSSTMVKWQEEFRKIKDIGRDYAVHSEIDHRLFPVLSIIESGNGKYIIKDKDTGQYPFNPLGIKGIGLNGYITMNTYE